MMKRQMTSKFGSACAALVALLAGWSATGCGNEDHVLGRTTLQERPGDAGPAGKDAGAADAGAESDPGCTAPGGGLAYDRAGCEVGVLQPAPGYCGDGQVQPPEECDDGNTLDDDDCSATCLLRVCGNDRVDPGETCDRIDATCSATCQIIPPPPPAACGNGVREGAEECDDGNTTEGDGCSAVCLTESCGNHRRDFGESCDPPDPETGACDAQCHVVRCGDGQKAATEECDDGNQVSGDGCDAACKLEGCGDDRLGPGEDCEPPGTDRCDAHCHAVRIECGNKKLEEGEACDDGNARFGDGCSPTCQIEKCGNNHVEAPAEECEPPGTRGCTSHCKRPRCGDGELSAPDEECEDGNANNGDGCSADCHLELCGNGKLEVPEECEPTLSSNCSSSCKLLGASELAVPVSGAAFALANSGFDGSLIGWQQSEATPSAIDYSALDANGTPNSGAAQIAPAASLQQCVRTSAGAEYQVASRVRLLPGQDQPAALDLGVRFYAGARCTGEVLDGLVTSRAVDSEDGDWSLAMLPPESFDTTLAAPDGAGSMVIWFEAVAGGASVLLDEVELVRVDPNCGDGIPDESEECEPSVTAGCHDDCTLPRDCGDGIAAPGECAGPAACTEDCGLPAICGDGKVTGAEECDPPHADTCTPQCTIIHNLCGDGIKQEGEDCDPPDGKNCGFECQHISCGDGKIDAPETCDPPCPDCSHFCRLNREQPSRCGNGLLEGAEQCDPPNLDTWCTSSCQRRNPADACGDGEIDADLGEQCDPPSFAANCGTDCKKPRCGDGKVTGSEECEPGLIEPENCGQDCQFRDTKARGCVDCLASSCSAPAGAANGTSSEDLFADCFALKGVAQAGPAQGTPLSQLCIEAVDCLRQTDCAVEHGSDADPLSCYCGKEVILDSSNQDTLAEEGRKRAALLACRDGSEPAHGACRAAIERAAEATGPGLAVAAFDAKFGRPAVLAAVRLMTECGQKEGGTCKSACSVPPSCGDGVTGAGEPCDRTDPMWAGKCSETCTVLPCGNGVVDPGETCDVADPYTNVNNSCDKKCQLETVCGDGRLTPSVEACDPGPNGSWAECCRPSKDDPQGLQLKACDKDGDNRVRDTIGPNGEPPESCQIPSECGNKILEGLEQCDDPDRTKCSDKCQIIAPETPCDVCAKQNCQDTYVDCFSNQDKKFSADCIKVMRCIDETKCAPDGNTLSCLCGDLLGSACYVPNPPGACAGAFLDGAIKECPSREAACLVPIVINPANPTGAAGQWMQCKADYCYTECYGG